MIIKIMRFGNRLWICVIMSVFFMYLCPLSKVVSEEEASIDYSSPIVQAVLKVQKAVKENKSEVLWKQRKKIGRERSYDKFKQKFSGSAEAKLRSEASIESIEIITPKRAWVKLCCLSLPLSEQGYYLIQERGEWKLANIGGYVLWVESQLKLLRKAVMDYYRDKEVLPKNLSELIPNYLKEIPIDLFNDDNKEYGYLLDKEWFRLYSVGPDSHDDLGLIEYDQKKGLFCEGDIVAKGEPKK